MAETTDSSKPRGGSSSASRRLIVQGITWTAAYQLAEVVLGFASMLVLVRIIDARDYGRAAAVGGILGLLNNFNAHLCVEHALQLSDDEQPDWQTHWTFAFYIQLALAVVAQAVAGLCWLSADYRPIAKLLHIASLGLILDWPNQLSATMLRRDLQWRRLRIVAGVGMTLRLATTMVLALAGAGAYAIVIGSNVMTTLPFTIDLLVVRRWRPRPGWFRLPDWGQYAAPATFGLQRVGAQVISSLRGAAEAVLLPAPLGFAALGLLNRAQALYTTTFGRIATVLADVVYPFLPRSSHDPKRYASHATMYVRVMLLVSVPAGFFVADYGPILSRVLYGTRWADMDPLIRPGAVVSVALSVLMIAGTVLMAAGRMRDCLVFEGIGAVGAVPAFIVAWGYRQALAYSWACAAAEVVIAGAALHRASPLLQRGWARSALVPPFASAAAGLVCTRAVALAVAGLPAVAQLVSVAFAFTVVNVVVMRVAFPHVLDDLLAQAPAGDHLRRILRLRTAAPVFRHALVPDMSGDLP